MPTEHPSPERIHQIPNPLALAHFLSTSPLFHDRAVFVVMENAAGQHILSSALAHLSPTTHILEWDSYNPFQLSDIRRSSYVITNADALSRDDLPAPSIFTKQSLSLAVGDTIEQRTLKSFFAQSGYEVDATANIPGAWSARGEIIDVHLKRPTRITFDNTTIESIAEFDLLTGKTTDQLSRTDLPPLNLYGRTSVLKYIPDNFTVVMYHGEPFSEIPQQQILIDPFASKGSMNAGYTETKSYQLRYEDVLSDAAGKDTYVFTHDPEKATAIFAKSENTPKVYALSADARGFVHAENAVIALTDVSIGITQERKKKQSEKMQQALIQQLAPGDYVVHMYHGIAQFSGMKTMHVNGLDREYFVLAYADNDKIYVPVEQAERLDKYIGDTVPTLQKLSDASWHEVVKRVKEQSLEMARELLQLYAAREHARAPQFAAHEAEERALDAECPFELTSDQATALDDIYHDIAQASPMDRLLCGDVGFGKTEVAMRAAYRAVLNGYQVAVLAPTTVLAQQHVDTFAERFKSIPITIAGLSRMQSQKEQDEIVSKIRAGKVDIVVGTHRLLSQDINFKKMGLMIIDEEQRFGVKAKERLKHVRKDAHVLTMTATPIPRTLHLSLAGIREISTITTPPHERKAVETRIQRMDNDAIRDALTAELARDGQAYYVYNRVRSIEKKKVELEALVPKAVIAIAHGQMSPGELAKVMHAFDIGEIDVLLCTTIVENGLDIPNANTIIVENASHFGLAELYQMRGRVGRSTAQGHALFCYTEQQPDGDAKKRFIALQDSQHLGAGFELAMKDMEIRGVGNILGKEQHGHAVKIGLNLYVRLLNQSIRELKDTDTHETPARDIPIDLPLETRIPEELLPEQNDRILLYQRLASITDINELQSKREEYSKDGTWSRNSTLHPALAALFDVLEIKLLASRSTLLSIDTLHPNTQNRLTSPRITLTAEKNFQDTPNYWEHVFTKDLHVFKIRATLDELGPNWTQKVKHIIGLQRKHQEG